MDTYGSCQSETIYGMLWLFVSVCKVIGIYGSADAYWIRSRW